MSPHHEPHKMERDDRWTAVDRYTLSHCHPPSRPNHAALEDASRRAEKAGLPPIATFPVFAKMLALQCRIGRVKHALEIGTLGGYTSIWLATENPDMRVTTLEVNPKFAEIARQNIENAGVADRVNLILGPALDSLQDLRKQMDNGELDKFGFVFVDADKLNNATYVDACIPMCIPGAPIIVDNVVRRGTIVSDDPEERDGDGARGARDVIEKVGKDPRLDAVVMQTVSDKNYDGFIMSVVL